MRVLVCVCVTVTNWQPVNQNHFAHGVVTQPNWRATCFGGAFERVIARRARRDDDVKTLCVNVCVEEGLSPFWHTSAHLDLILSHSIKQ